MRTLARVSLLTVMLAACTDIISPPRVTIYEYRLLIPDGEGGNDPLAFHWPREQLPVRIWIAPDDDLRPALIRAMSIWEDTFLYGEFRSELAASESEADIIVRNATAPAKLASQFRLASLADECRGETTFLADVEEESLTPPFEVYVWAVFPGHPDLPECYELTVLHELGHAIGIFAHSPSPDDLMYADPTRNSLSERDRATAEAAYHLPATVRPER